MARYFVHLRDGIDDVLDEDGVEYGSIEILRTAVMASARDLMCGDLERGVLDLRCRLDAEDTDGKIVYTLPFKHAVNIIPEG